MSKGTTVRLIIHPPVSRHRSLHRHSQANRTLHHPFQLVQQFLLPFQPSCLILQFSALLQGFLHKILLSHLLESLHPWTLDIFTNGTGRVHHAHDYEIMYA